MSSRPRAPQVIEVILGRTIVVAVSLAAFLFPTLYSSKPVREPANFLIDKQSFSTTGASNFGFTN